MLLDLYIYIYIWANYAQCRIILVCPISCQRVQTLYNVFVVFLLVDSKMLQLQFWKFSVCRIFWCTFFFQVRVAMCALIRARGICCSFLITFPHTLLPWSLSLSSSSCLLIKVRSRLVYGTPPPPPACASPPSLPLLPVLAFNQKPACTTLLSKQTLLSYHRWEENSCCLPDLRRGFVGIRIADKYYKRWQSAWSCYLWKEGQFCCKLGVLTKPSRVQNYIKKLKKNFMALAVHETPLVISSGHGLPVELQRHINVR